MSTKLKCKNSGCQKDFLVIKAEEKFLAKKDLPMPDLCPACRHRQRMALRNERKLYKRDCDFCKEEMLSTIPDTSPYKIYCQKCFWDEIG